MVLRPGDSLYQQAETVKSTVAALAALIISPLAHADGGVSYFDDGVIHFEVGDNVVVSQMGVGDVRVITARTTASSGTVESLSFVTLTVFDGACAPTDCRDRILSGLTSTLGDSLSRPATLPSDPSTPVDLAIAHDGAEAAGELRVLYDDGGLVVVAYTQIDSGEGVPELATLAASVALGPASAPSTDEH